jgi:FkbM family methyltransferase
MERQSFFKHAAVYGLANALLQAGSFLLVLVYTRCLSPAQYGVLEVVGRLAETVGTCLMFGGFRQALMTFYQQADGAAPRRSIVCSALGLYAFWAVVGGALAILLSPVLCDLLAPDLSGPQPTMTPGLLRLAILGILLEPFSLIPLTLLQARVQSVTYILIVVCQLVFRVTASLLLVWYFRWGVAGALTATAVTGLLFGLALSARELARGTVWPSPQRVKALVLFALPLMPGGLCYFVLHHGDRFFLLRYASPEEVGTYALGYKLAMTVSIFSLTPLYMVWSARMYAVARTPEAPVVFGQMFTRILASYIFAGLGLCLFGDHVVALIGGAAYARSSLVIVPVLIACVCQGAVSLMDAGLYVRHRTGTKLAITLAATVVMLVLYRLLIPTYHGVGAALATLGGFVFLGVGTWHVTQRIFPVTYEWRRLALLLALAGGLWALALALPEERWALAAKAGLWALAPLLAWAGGLVTADEKQFVRAAARAGLARLPALLGGEARPGLRMTINTMLMDEPDRAVGAQAPPGHEDVGPSGVLDTQANAGLDCCLSHQDGSRSPARTAEDVPDRRSTMLFPRLARAPLALFFRALPLRGLWRLAPWLSRLFPRDVVEARLRGVGRVRLDLNDGGEQQLYWAGLGRENRQIIRLVRSALPPDGVFLDVGANIGIHTLAAARHVAAGGGAVVAFEPHPQNFRTLLYNIERNGLRHVVAHSVGLAEAPEVLICHGQARGGNWSLASRGDHSFAVRLVRLDDHLDDEPLPRIDLMKIDVEGAEVRVLQGARRTIERFRPRIIFEVCPSWLGRMNTNVAELLGTLEGLGYTIHRLPEGRALHGARIGAAELAHLGRGEFTNLVAVPKEREQAAHVGAARPERVRS